MPSKRFMPVIAILLVVAGCQPAAAPDAEDTPAAIESRFDPTSAGSISGTMRWLGTPPVFPPIDAVTLRNNQIAHKTIPNPNGLSVDSKSGALAGAVVFLDGISPEAARPWDLSPVRIEITDDQIRVIQGDQNLSRIGFVHAGAEIEMVSRDSEIQVLSVRGAAHFSLAFPDPDQPLRRKFTRPGLIELGSGAARYWQRAYLWVGGHPYFTLTDAAGRFILPQVPPGEYRLVCWHPNGKIAAIDRDPNTGMVLRYEFAEPFQTAQKVTVRSQEQANLDCWLGP